MLRDEEQLDALALLGGDLLAVDELYRGKLSDERRAVQLLSRGGVVAAGQLEKKGDGCQLREL